MSTEEFNPFASPTADISPTKSPEKDELYPLVPTTKATISEVPPPFRGKARPLLQRFLRNASEGIVRLTFALPFLLMYLVVPQLASPQFVIGVVVGLPFLWFLSKLEKATNGQRWWEPRMIEQIVLRDDALFSANDTPYELIYLTTGEPIKRRSFQLFTKVAEIKEVALIRFDKSNGEVLIEGDLTRYRIPKGSLWNVDVKQIYFNSSERSVVRMVMDTEHGPTTINILSTDNATWRDLVRLDTSLKSRALGLIAKIYEINNGLTTPEE